MRAKLIEFTAVRFTARAKVSIGEQLFDDRLRIVERAFERDVVDIGVAAMSSSGGAAPR